MAALKAKALAVSHTWQIWSEEQVEKQQPSLEKLMPVTVLACALRTLGCTSVRLDA